MNWQSCGNKKEGQPKRLAFFFMILYQLNANSMACSMLIERPSAQHELN
jgi:hypothetical protein